jgi:hypothetical protein
VEKARSAQDWPLNWDMYIFLLYVKSLIFKGDILRQQVEKQTPLGMEASRAMNEGAMVSTVIFQHLNIQTIILKILIEKLKENEKAPGFLIGICFIF